MTKEEALREFMDEWPWPPSDEAVAFFNAGWKMAKEDKDNGEVQTTTAGDVS